MKAEEKCLVCILMNGLCVHQVRMSQVKQVGLLAAGCQPWNKDVCAASGDRFAYCATLAIYIYQVQCIQCSAHSGLAQGLWFWKTAFNH